MFRRARFSVKPNVRPGAQGRGGGSDPAAPAAEPQRDLDPSCSISPAAASKTPVPQVPQFSPFKKSISKDTNVCLASNKGDEILQKNMPCPLKERPTQGRLIQEEITLPKPTSVTGKQISSDRERILKAQKLRLMLKEELKKERKSRRSRQQIIERSIPQEHSKMVMRDFIYYLPENNPMRCLNYKNAPEHEEGDEDVEEEEGDEDKDKDGPLLVPRVKVAEDGSIILDEESLTVEVLRTKGPCVVEENDPIFERGSTTTYSSFRKSYYTKPWSNKGK
uniref:Uncharacterized protein n=1 Tax=Sphenodon punctatus TaxID=8508 RepID=A0A8D0G5Z7_SPHPU